MSTTQDVLCRGLERRGDEWTLTLDPAFQGLPETAHGGSVLAAFHLAAGAERATVSGLYQRRVPLNVALRLTVGSTSQGTACRLFDADAATLVDGHVASLGGSVSAGSSHTTVAPGHDAFPLPISRTCFACGIDNPLGLRAQLRHDERAVGGTWRPDETHRVDGAVTPAALTSLLDEAAFWLGALASGESGMTTELAVTLHRPVAFGAPITIGGRRADVTALPSDRRYWTTRVAAWDDQGCVAEAAITFVAVRGAARRLITAMLSINPPDVIARVFPTAR